MLLSRCSQQHSSIPQIIIFIVRLGLVSPTHIFIFGIRVGVVTPRPITHRCLGGIRWKGVSVEDWYLGANTDGSSLPTPSALTQEGGCTPHGHVLAVVSIPSTGYQP